MGLYHTIECEIRDALTETGEFADIPVLSREEFSDLCVRHAKRRMVEHHAPWKDVFERVTRRIADQIHNQSIVDFVIQSETARDWVWFFREYRKPEPFPYAGGGIQPRLF